MSNVKAPTATVRIDGALPRGWSQDAACGNGSRITLAGPDGLTGPAQIEIEAGVGTGTIEDATQRVIEELRCLPVERQVTSCDLWPHRQWGTGRQVQSAYTTHATTMAHDVYVFVDGDHELRATLHCALADLLLLEEDCARIIAAASVAFSRSSHPAATTLRPSPRSHSRRHMRAVRSTCVAGAN